MLRSAQLKPFRRTQTKWNKVKAKAILGDIEFKAKAILGDVEFKAKAILGDVEFKAKAILVEQNAGFALFGLISYFVKSLMNTCPKDCLRCPGLASYHPFLDGTLSLRCATSRYLMSLKYET